MKKTEYSLIYRSLKTNRFAETKYMSESKIIELAQYTKSKGIEILGINKRKVDETFISYSDMFRYGYFD